MAVFDVIVNNADRKGAHILAMPSGHRYGVRHGLTFHVEDKLRTVLWGWLGEKLTEEKRDGVGRALDELNGELGRELLNAEEYKPSPNAAPMSSTMGPSQHRAG